MFFAPGRTLALGPIAEKYPQLQLIIDHMNASAAMAREGKLDEVIGQCVSLAKYPNVSVKVSNAPQLSREPYPFKDVAGVLKRVIDAYGPQRSYWGTDLTNSYAKASYRQRITHFTEELSFLSESDKDWIMGRAISERLKWT
jgi:predicted TIM-barrel fold metal-dependent hydrolase